MNDYRRIGRLPDVYLRAAYNRISENKAEPTDPVLVVMDQLQGTMEELVKTLRLLGGTSDGVKGVVKRHAPAAGVGGGVISLLWAIVELLKSIN